MILKSGDEFEARCLQAREATTSAQRTPASPATRWSSREQSFLGGKDTSVSDLLVNCFLDASAVMEASKEINSEESSTNPSSTNQKRNLLHFFRRAEEDAKVESEEKIDKSSEPNVVADSMFDTENCDSPARVTRSGAKRCLGEVNCESRFGVVGDEFHGRTIRQKPNVSMEAE